ncbi:MAG: hypothetical protein LPK07_02745 [Hymenobacteraceae bacterium]|nr:hypothetical protein [Hymenobacteraceae bacterium]MDX5480579.1 hypothetical protein [Hymenobacteraceae bacterium]
MILFKELKNNQDEVYFSVETDKEKKWIHGRLSGRLTMEQIKSVGLLYLELLQRTPYSKILHDSTQLQGSYIVANEWLESVCFAPAAQAGLTSLAVVVPEEQDIMLATQDLSNKASDRFKLRSFSEVEEAEEWLKASR